MAAPPTHPEPDQHELTRALQLLLDRTDTMAEAAVRRGVSHMTLRRLIDRGEVETIKLGRDIRVWR
jgi:excisionase family DNA binding protein